MIICFDNFFFFVFTCKFTNFAQALPMHTRMHTHAHTHSHTHRHTHTHTHWLQLHFACCAASVCLSATTYAAHLHQLLQSLCSPPLSAFLSLCLSHTLAPHAHSHQLRLRLVGHRQSFGLSACLVSLLVFVLSLLPSSPSLVPRLHCVFCYYYIFINAKAHTRVHTHTLTLVELVDKFRKV